MGPKNHCTAGRLHQTLLPRLHFSYCDTSAGFFEIRAVFSVCSDNEKSLLLTLCFYVVLSFFCWMGFTSMGILGLAKNMLYWVTSPLAGFDNTCSGSYITCYLIHIKKQYQILHSNTRTKFYDSFYVLSAYK